ncbi:MAG: hypothetical protein DRJ05_00145 [Bacteroidetes bacterium]|nr:MAG: hypothetical protein DRJ05_00145 [Bacteroidota bacterium]
MSEIPNHPVYSRNVLEMLTVANDYCMFMSKAETYSQKQLFDYLLKVGPLLYIKGSLLPDISVQNPDAAEKFLQEEEWESLFLALRKVLLKNDEFWFIDNSDLAENQAIKGSLSESFADIYQDLKDFLTLYQKSSLDAKENAVYELKQLFATHWGNRLVNAHKALHYLYYNLEEEEGKNRVSDFLV